MSPRIPRPAARPLLLAALLAVAIPSAIAAQDGAATPVPPVPRPDAILAEGRAIPVHSAALGVAAPGVVRSVAALGATVVAGDPLIVLEDAGEAARFDEARASLDGATAAAAQAAAGAARAAAAVDAATAGVDRASAQLDAAAAGVDRSQAAADEAVAAKDALPDIASNAQERQAKAVIAQAQSAVEEAKASRRAAEATLDQARAELRGALSAKTGAQQAAAAAAAEVRRAEAVVAAAEAALAERTIGAPFTGTIAWVGTRAGEHVTPGMPIIRLGDPTAWTFETTDLGESGAARIAPGDRAVVTIDDVEGIEIEGVVREVALYGEERQGDIAFRVIVDPAGTVPAAIRWNTILTIAIEPGSGSAAAAASPAAGS